MAQHSKVTHTYVKGLSVGGKSCCGLRSLRILEINQRKLRWISQSEGYNLQDLNDAEGVNSQIGS